MTVSVESLASLAAAAVVGVVTGLVIARRGGGARREELEPSGPSSHEDDVPAPSLRERALDAAGEAILILDPSGIVLDVNEAAFSLFARARHEMADVPATRLRQLSAMSGGEPAWQALVDTRAPWDGCALLRLPDGITHLSAVRLIPLLDGEGGVLAVAEVHRLPARADDAPPNAVALLQALRREGDDAEGATRNTAPEHDVRFLRAAFHDLERMLAQYDRLLPSIHPDDPLSEEIAGLAAETTELARRLDLPRLRREIPRALRRLRAGLDASGAGS